MFQIIPFNDVLFQIIPFNDVLFQAQSVTLISGKQIRCSRMVIFLSDHKSKKMICTYFASLVEPVIKTFKTDATLGKLYFLDFFMYTQKFKAFMTDATSEEDMYNFRASARLRNRSSYGLLVTSLDHSSYPCRFGSSV